ncbi:MAG: aminotransferase class I/II-fold pyridoxal phosphate-dependent enzyme [Rhizomicrobium sp.]
MPSLDQFAQAKLAELDAAHLRRTLVETARTDGIWVMRDGRRLLSFSCNDYLNLTQHPAVKSAAIAAIEEYGAGAGASRLITGNHPLFAALEERLARRKGTEAACVFGSGYLANAGIIPVVAGPDDLLLVDALSHACLWAGAQLSRAAVTTFRHNDVAHAAALLAAHRAQHRHALIVTDSVFSMDGDVAPLDALSALAHAHDAWLMSDDAHGLGVVASGTAKAELQMGTLSKALGSYGGYLCASRPVIDLVKTRARTFVYSTGLPPASVAAAIAALDVIDQDAALTARPLRKAQDFSRALNLLPPQSPIVPIVLGSAVAALQASQELEREGFLVAAIRPPTVPDGTARLRFAFTAAHPDAQIARMADIVRERILV